MNILTAKKLPEMVLKQSFMRDIHFESVFDTKYVNTKVRDDWISEPNFVYAIYSKLTAFLPRTNNLLMNIIAIHILILGRTGYIIIYGSLIYEKKFLFF